MSTHDIFSTKQKEALFMSLLSSSVAAGRHPLVARDFLGELFRRAGMPKEGEVIGGEYWQWLYARRDTIVAQIPAPPGKKDDV